MAYLDNNGLSHLWSKIVNLFNKRIEVSETAPTEEENKIWLQPMTTNAGTVDYIVDEGISDIWTYRKWNSGILEMWGHLLNVPLAFFDDNGIYRCTDLVVALPFPITQVETYGVINTNCTSNICAIWVDHVYFSQGGIVGVADDTTPATHIVYNVFQHSGLMDGIVGKFYFSVKGRWK